MRPISIRWFDRLFLSGLALELAARVIGTREALYITNKENAPVLIAMNITFFFVMSAVWFAISRYHSKIAKWALTTLLVAIPIVLAVTAIQPAEILANLNLESSIFRILRPALYVAATIMLFRSDTRAWFSDGRRALKAGNVG